MLLTNLLPLILFAVVSTLSPGGATTVATISGVRYGFLRSLPFIAGVVAGLALMSGVAARGLAGIIQGHSSLQLAMKLAGSLYLLILAVRMARSASPHSGASLSKPPGFMASVWLVWLNPKGWAMSLGAAASYAIPQVTPGLQAIIQGLTLGLAGLLSLSLWCVAGSVLARQIKTESGWRRINRLMALLLVVSVIPFHSG